MLSGFGAARAGSGQRVRTLPARRFNALPLSGGNGVQILRFNPNRVGVSIQNFGTGTAYVDDSNLVDNTKFPIPPGSALNFPAPWGPQGEMYAVGDANHDLRILEVVTY